MDFSCFAKVTIEANQFSKGYKLLILFFLPYPLTVNSLNFCNFALTIFVFMNVSEKSNLGVERLHTI